LSQGKYFEKITEWRMYKILSSREFGTNRTLRSNQ